MGNPNTDVFVVTEGLLGTPTSLFYASSNQLSGTSGTLTTSGGIGNISTYTTGGTGTYTINTLGNVGIGTSSPSTRLDIYPSYNDFWKFDEEFDILWKSFFDNNASFKPIKEKAVSHPCDIQETDNGLKIEIAAVGLPRKTLISLSIQRRYASRTAKPKKTRRKRRKSTDTCTAQSEKQALTLDGRSPASMS